MQLTEALGSCTKEAMPAWFISQQWLSATRPVPPIRSPDNLDIRYHLARVLLFRTHYPPKKRGENSCSYWGKTAVAIGGNNMNCETMRQWLFGAHWNEAELRQQVIGVSNSLMWARILTTRRFLDKVISLFLFLNYSKHSCWQFLKDNSCRAASSVMCQDSQGELVQDSGDRTAGTGQPGQDIRDKTAGTGQPGQDSRDRKARIGQPGEART